MLDPRHAGIVAHPVAEHRDVVRQHADRVALRDSAQDAEHLPPLTCCAQKGVAEVRQLEVYPRFLNKLLREGVETELARLEVLHKRKIGRGDLVFSAPRTRSQRANSRRVEGTFGKDAAPVKGDSGDGHALRYLTAAVI